jgi:DNA-binding protein Fis
MESEQMYCDKGMIPDGEYLIPIGKANIVKAGKDVTLVTFGKMLSRVVMPAVEELEKQGISVEVIDLRSVRPIDYLTVVEPPLLQSVLEHYHGNRVAAASHLGLHRSTLRQKMRHYNIDPGP